jgi:hypothetical protein
VLDLVQFRFRCQYYFLPGAPEIGPQNLWEDVFDRNVNFREILFHRFSLCAEACSRRRNARWRIPSG